MIELRLLNYSLHNVQRKFQSYIHRQHKHDCSITVVATTDRVLRLKFWFWKRGWKFNWSTDALAQGVNLGFVTASDGGVAVWVTALCAKSPPGLSFSVFQPPVWLDTLVYPLNVKVPLWDRIDWALKILELFASIISWNDVPAIIFCLMIYV